jgi:hypothetical protein
MRRNFRGLMEAARPQAMATERDMLSLRVAELQEVRPAMAAPSTISPP